MKPGLYQDGKRIGDIEKVEMNRANVETVRYMTLESAIALAANLHRGQKDLAGEPYILHPLRVMSKFKTYEGRMVAILHDVVEDTTWNLEDLQNANVPDVVLNAIDAITRRKEVKELYQEYLYRVRENYWALHVKIEDLRDNLDMNRLSPKDVAKHESLFKRETKALAFCLTFQTYNGVV